MYYKDLSKYCYLDKEEVSYNVGWLGRFHRYNKGDVSEEFLDFLWEYLRYPVNVCRGFHECEFCKNRHRGVPIIEYKGVKRKAGYYEIRVFDKDGTMYAAPSLIFHYIVEHNYRPPQKFIDAVMATGDILNEEYYNKVLKYWDNKDFWLAKDCTLLKEETEMF